MKSGENSVTTPNEGKDSVRKMGPDPGQHQLREVKASEQGLFQWLLGSMVLVDTSPRGGEHRIGVCRAVRCGATEVRLRGAHEVPILSRDSEAFCALYNTTKVQVQYLAPPECPG